MQYILLIYADENAWSTFTPEQRAAGMAQYGAYNEALRKAGAMVNADQLQPTMTAATVRPGANGEAQVLNGPYIDTKEALGGYYLIEAADQAAAIEWAKKCPATQHGIVEVRPVVMNPLG